MARYAKGTFLLFFGLLAFFAASASFAAVDERLGADHAEPGVARFLAGLPLKPGTLHECTESETLALIELASNEHINVFELIDCVFRYVAPQSIRVRIYGDFLRLAENDYDLGGERVLAILSIDSLRYLEFGARLSEGQTDLDIFMSKPRESFIEIGTARYEARFGFKKVSPLLFGEAYGVMVTKLFIKTPLKKLELFSPGKGAIYVNALSKPKRWNLNIIRKKPLAADGVK